MRFPLLALAFATLVPAQTQGLVFANGTTGYVDVPNTPALVPSTGVTAEAWVTYNSALGPGWRYPTILRMDPSPNTASYFLRIEAGQTLTNRLLWWVRTTNGTYSTGWNFPAGTLSSWTHVAGTYDGAALRLFVNGAQVAQIAGSGTIAPTSATFRIGSGDLTVVGGETWNGEIDEVRIWPVARSAAAIAAAMNQQLQSLPGNVAVWNLEGNAVASSGGHVGTLVGTAAFATNTRPEQQFPWNGLTEYGYGSGCQSGGRITVNSLATVGNQAFAFAGTPAGASPLGLLVLGLTAWPVALPVLGIDVFVDPTGGVIASLAPGVLGATLGALPIPATPAVQGFTVHAQFAWLDGACVSGFSASPAVAMTVLP